MDPKIAEQFLTLRFALDVGQKQITEFEDRLKGKFDSLSSVDEKKTFLQNEATYLFLKNFWQQYEFLVKKIEKEDDLANFQFYIPLARILLEIYGEFLYFINQDAKGQVGIYSANYLLYLTDFYRFVSVGNQKIKNEYDRLRTVWNDVLSSDGISYAEDISAHTQRIVNDLGFNFPHYDQIFQKPYFAEQSYDTLALWQKDTAKTFYNKYYRSHSNYTHPSFTNQMSGATQNEVFWLIQFLFIAGQLMIELCNRKIFDGKFKSEYNELTRHIAETYPRLQEIWNPGK